VRRRSSILLALLVASAVPAALSKPNGNERTRRILRLQTRAVETVPLEAYVAAVLPAEIGSHAPDAALEAQAVAARSYALAKSGRHEDEGADLCDGTHCQVFQGLARATAATRRAAEVTCGLVLAQGGHVIAAPFSANCGGRTARPADVWDDEETPELESVEDDACLGTAGAVWTYRLLRAAIPELGEALGLPEARFLEVFGRDAGERVTAVRLAGPGGKSLVVRGFAFRKSAAELWGWASVRSTWFDIEETRHEYVLSGRGTGHGAGLCQTGAIVRAKRGETWEAILAHYYRGAQVVALDAVEAGARKKQ
jgi:stage II sporulation protein D